MSVDFTAARTNMVESQVRTADVTDLPIQDAMRIVAREALLDAAKRPLAYADAEVEYAPGRWLLRPRDVAKLLQMLHPRPGERCLGIAAPYASAVLEAMGLSVTQIDAAQPPPPGASFDVIVCEGAVTRSPSAWTASLAAGGRLGVVERTGPQGRAMLYLRAGDTVGARPVFDSTPPLLAGFAPSPTFTF